MSEPLKKVRSGERLRIPAPTYNAFVDAAQAHRNQQGVRARTGRDVAPDGTILVRNDTGSDQSQFAILGLNGPLFEPTSLQAFKNHPRIVKCIVPATGTHDNKFVILAQPIAAGKMGRAIISGVYLAKVNVTDAGHDYATITDSETGYFTSAVSGPVQILWKETGTGQKWAQIIVRGTASIGGAGIAVYRRISAHVTDGQYYCYLQKWESAAWANANAVQVVCKVTLETSGHAFNSASDFFIAVGNPDANGIVPVAPLGYAFAY